MRYVKGIAYEVVLCTHGYNTEVYVKYRAKYNVRTYCSAFDVVVQTSHLWNLTSLAGIASFSSDVTNRRTERTANSWRKRSKRSIDCLWVSNGCSLSHTIYRHITPDLDPELVGDIPNLEPLVHADDLVKTDEQNLEEEVTVEGETGPATEETVDAAPSEPTRAASAEDTPIPATEQVMEGEHLEYPYESDSCTDDHLLCEFANVTVDDDEESENPGEEKLSDIED
jgi:hypothetical protein